MAGASVRDVSDFEALPDDVQALAKRVIEPPPLMEPDEVPLDLVEAYSRGWHDCQDDASIDFGSCPGNSEIRERLAPKPKKKVA